MDVRNTGSLVFIDNMTTVMNLRMNSEVYRAIISVHIQLNAMKVTGLLHSVD